MLYTPAFAALYLANFTLVASFAAFFLFPLFITGHGGNQQDIGIIMGVFALASALCRPWIAEMIDRIGRKRSYTIGCAIMTLMPLFYLTLQGNLSNYYPFLILLRIIHGIGLAICFTAIFTFIVDLIPANRLNEGIGMFGTSGLIGMAVGPLISEPILGRFGFPAFFITAAGLAAIALLLQAPIKDKHHLQPEESEPSPSFFTLLKTRKQLVCGGLAILFGFGLAATGSFIAPFAQTNHLSYISLYYLAYSTAAVGVRFIAGKMADRLGENQIIPWGFILAASGLLLVPLVHGNLLLLVVGFIFGIGHGLLFPALNAMAVRGEPYAVRGKVTGIFTGGIDTGIFCGALILGTIGELAGFTVLFICAGLMVLSALYLFRLRPDQSSGPH
ncbi:MAG: MFS transporter [Desulfuromusa sp.]|nr:MFS transporter [Desulfuromusa sp.]